SPAPDAGGPGAAAAAAGGGRAPGGPAPGGAGLGRPYPGAAGCPRVLPSLWSEPRRTGKVPHVELRVSSRSQGAHTIVMLAGEIDLYTAPRLESERLAAMRSANPAPQLGVDLSRSEFCAPTPLHP